MGGWLVLPHALTTRVVSAPQAPASAIPYDELQGLTYLQVKGSGIANTCPVIDGGSSNLKDVKAGNYKIQKLCLEPTSFTVKEESQFKGQESDFTPTKLMTRLTYTLDEVRVMDASYMCYSADLHLLTHNFWSVTAPNASACLPAHAIAAVVLAWRSAAWQMLWPSGHQID